MVLKHILTGKQVDELVEPLQLIDGIERLLKAGFTAPRRLAVTHRGSWIGVMLAVSQGYFAVKVVGVYPDNVSRGLPLVRGILNLFDANSGEVLLTAPAEEATGWRTAAASALALRLMGYHGGGTLGVIGAGVQAEYHVRVIGKVFGYDELLVYSRTREKAERLAARHGGSYAELEELLAKSDVVVAATTSRTPVVKGKLLRRGAYVVSVGAPRPVKELDEDVVKRAGCVLVDTREGVMAESDDVPGWARVVELAELVRGETECRFNEIAVYKSVGTAVFDLAIAIHLYERLRSTGMQARSS